MKKPTQPGPVVLLAEDDDSFRMLCRMSFLSAGFRVLEARDGPQAIEQALEGSPAAIVLDLWLPGLAGREVMRILRTNKAFAKTPILVVSGVPEVKDREGLLADGADEVLEKPVPPARLVAVVEGLVLGGRPAPRSGRRRLESAGGDA